MRISRRRFFARSAAMVGGVGLLGAAAARAQQTKVAKSVVAYQETPNEGHSCAGCSLFEPPNACKAVAGDISPSGWCKLWSPKS